MRAWVARQLNGFRKSTRRIGGDEGSSVLEFGLVCIVLFTFLFGIMDFSRFLFAYHFVSEVSREATRYAAVRGYTFHGTSCTTTGTTYYACAASASDVTTYVESLTPTGLNSSFSSGGSCSTSTPCVTATWPGTTAAGQTCGTVNYPGCEVEVTVTYPFKFLLPFLPSSATTYTVSGTSEMVISQ